MTLDPEFLELLACPVCKGPLAELADPEALRCERCRLDYPIEDGIPVLLADRAVPHE